MKRLLSFALLPALLILFLPEGYVQASQPDYSATVAKISALIGKKMAEEQIVGMSVALVDGQKVVWAQGFGYADKEKGMKAGPGTFYEIGSCSKTLAALAIMTLVEKGLVDLDRPIEEYLPKFSIRQRFPQSGPITLRTIMTHHSGIPGDLYHGSFDYSYHPEVYDRIMELLREEYTAFPTNFVWAYSNTAITLEGAVVEAVMKQSFLDYGEALLRKIGMKESSWIPRSTFADRRARGYYKGSPVPDYYISIAPAGSILSSVLEMAEYIKMMLTGGGGVVKPETIEKMITRQNGDVPLDVSLSQGLAWVLIDPGLAYAGRLCWHTGGSLGQTSRVEILMDHGLGAVAITNSMTGVAVANTVVQEILKSALEEKEGLKPPPEAKPVFSRVITWPAKKLKDVAGIYVTQSGYDIFKPTKGGLIWRSWLPPSAETAKGKSEKKDHNDVKLVPRENGFFSKTDSPDKEIEFTEISGREVAVGHVKGQRVLLGERYRPVPMPAVWKKRLGRYEIANLPPGNINRDMPPELQYNATSFVMDKRDGLLIINVYDSCGPADLVIEPVTNSFAFIRGLGMGKGEAVRVMKVDGREQIRYRGSLYTKVP